MVIDPDTHQYDNSNFALQKALTPPTVDATVKNTAKKTDKPSLLVTNRDVKNFFDDDDDEDDDEVEKNALKNDELVKTSEPTTQPTATQPSNKVIKVLMYLNNTSFMGLIRLQCNVM